jgi:hypothetical protein
MVGYPSERLTVGPRLLCICLLTAGWLLSPSLSHAQSASSGTSQGVAGSFQILNQRKVYFGQHSVTMNRIAPPNLPTLPPAPTPAPIQIPASVVNFGMMIFSATVYDHQYSVIQRFDGDQTVVAVSNIDFSLFTTQGSFIEGNSYYELIIALDEESTADNDPTTAAWLTQAQGTLPASTPSYVVVSGTASADDVAGLNAIHSYYAANSTDILQAYQQLQARNAAAALQAKLHPPRRPNTVINYWPIKSAVYRPGGAQ